MAVTETRRAAATTEPETVTERGMSLARGPALVLGTILLAAGLYMLYKEHTFPPFSNFPNGKAPVESKVFGVFGANGWTGMLTAIAGGLLLFGAAAHLLAKTMSLIVGVCLGAAAVIALISGDVLGLAAANHMTELAWGIAAAILLVNTLAPRRRRTVAVADGRRPVTRAAADGEHTRVIDDRDTRDTRVMHEHEVADEPTARDGEDTRVMDARDGTDTRVPDDHDHEETDEPFAPDGMETRVMADRDQER